MNLLLTCAGRRSYLVKYFRAALVGAGKVICTNSDTSAPAMQVADLAIAVPRSDHPEYVQTILDICATHDVRMVTSLHDLDGYVLSRYKQDFISLGCHPILPDPEIARLCLDKHEMNQTLAGLGVGIPWSSLHISQALEAIHSGTVRWPLLVKDRTGFGSTDMLKCYAEDDLEYAVRKANRQGRLVEGFYRPAVEPDQAALIQEAICGKEFCLGLIADLGGNLVGMSRSEIHAMRAGESDSATTCDVPEDQELATSLADFLRVPGYCGIDYLQRGRTKLVIDINPRFTGDYPFSHLAGLNVPSLLVAWVNGKSPDTEWLIARAGVRGYKDIVLQKG